MAFGKKLLVALAEGTVGAVPGVGGFLAEMAGLADTGTDDQLRELKTLVSALDVRLKHEMRLTQALLETLSDAPAALRDPLKELADAVAHPDALPQHVVEALDRIDARFKSQEEFVEHCTRVYATQQACATGGSIVVQIQGDGNVVLIGGDCGLTLETPAWRRARKNRFSPDLWLLRPDAATTDFLGRTEMLDEFLAWVTDPAVPFSARALVGGPGAGKTRFALELLKSLGANDAGPDSLLSPGAWCGGFVRIDLVRDLGLLAALCQCRWPNPVLFIVDYAAAAGRTLRTWLNQLATPAAPHGRPVRVLLLEREKRGGWFEELVKYAGDTDPGLATLFHPPGPIPLPPLPQLADRRTIYEKALAAYAEEHKTTPPRLPPPGADKTFDGQLAEERWGDPLFLMMAAAVAVTSEGAQRAVHVLSLSRTDLAKELADREIRGMTRGADDEATAKLRPVLAAASTLAKGLSRPDAVTLAKAAAEATGYRFPTGEGALVDGLARLLPGEDRALGVIAPDIIGEAFIVQVLGDRPDGGLDAPQRLAVLLALLKVNRDGSLETLIHVMQDFGPGDDSILEWLDALVGHADAKDFDLLLDVADALAVQSFILAERAAAIYRTILERLRSVTNPPDADAHDNMTATSLNNMGVHLSALGRHEEALEATQKATDLYRSLAAARPDAYTADLAASLSNLGNILSNLGRHEEALEATQEAVNLYRRLAAARSDAYTANLASSLNNLGIRLSALGRHEEALEAAQEAMDIRRRLAAARPDAYTADLASSLSNLGNCLRALGRHEEALDAAQEAVDIRRGLFAARPDAYTADLATSLNNLGNRLSALGRHEEALDAAKEAVGLYHRLAAARPDAFAADLAASLSNMGGELSALGRHEEALDAAQEAVGFYRRLAAARPDAYAADLAMSLNNLGNRLSALGRHEEALDTVQEAVDIRRRLAAARPDAYTADLAMSLGALHLPLKAAGRKQEALETVAEGIRTLTPMFLALPAAHARLMATLCRAYIALCEELGVEPQADLLAPVLEVFGRLRADGQAPPNSDHA
jgi:tetratricopeptide (TPR) repeat protein